MAETNNNIVVLISGSGSNLQALIDGVESGLIAGRISAVISNKADAFGLTRAQNVGIATHVLSHQDYHDRDSYDQALIQLITPYQPKLVVLAGFMRILSSNFIEAFYGRLLNIHPSLLPKYKGLSTHRRVLEAGDAEHGVSVHFVSAELDGGPVIAQSICSVQQGDSESDLARRVQRSEHQLYPQVVSWFINGELYLQNERVNLHGESLTQPLVLDFNCKK